LPTTSDKPHEPVIISAAGVLSPEEISKADEERKKAQEASGGEDIWEVSEQMDQPDRAWLIHRTIPQMKRVSMPRRQRRH
jgi:hypothetical protein